MKVTFQLLIMCHSWLSFRCWASCPNALTNASKAWSCSILWAKPSISCFCWLGQLPLVLWAHGHQLLFSYPTTDCPPAGPRVQRAERDRYLCGYHGLDQGILVKWKHRHWTLTVKLSLGRWDFSELLTRRGTCWVEEIMLWYLRKQWKSGSTCRNVPHPI